MWSGGGAFWEGYAKARRKQTQRKVGSGPSFNVCIWVFPQTSNKQLLGHSLCILQLNSILTPSTWRGEGGWALWLPQRPVFFFKYLNIYLFILAAPDLICNDRDQTYMPCIGRWILNHWMTREVPRGQSFFFFSPEGSLKPKFSLCFWPPGYRSEVPPPPSLGSINLLKWLRELRETFSLLSYRFIIIGCILSNSQTEEMPRARHGGKSWNFHALSTHPTLSRSLCVHQPRNSRKTILLGF